MVEGSLCMASHARSIIDQCERNRNNVTYKPYSFRIMAWVPDVNFWSLVIL